MFFFLDLCTHCCFIISWIYIQHTQIITVRRPQDPRNYSESAGIYRATVINPYGSNSSITLAKFMCKHALHCLTLSRLILTVGQWYYTILYYTILYYTILYCTVMYCTILHYIILYYTILYTILYYTILYYTIYYTVLYYTILYYTILYTILYYTILYYTIL